VCEIPDRLAILVDELVAEDLRLSLLHVPRVPLLAG
jgi:hypothetical protein